MTRPPRKSRVATEKETLRHDFRRRIAAADVEARAASAETIAARVLELPELASARGILTCLSFGDEVDTWRLAAMLLGRGRELYVPRADRTDGKLHLHAYPCELVTLPFGLKQPPAHLPELPEEEIDGTIDAVLVLGLAFDRRGYRLGQGSGYFDRFLRGRPFPAIGLALDLQLVDRLPTTRRDVPMRAILTEQTLLRAARKPRKPRKPRKRD